MQDVQTLIDTIKRTDIMSKDDLLDIRRAFGRDLVFSPSEADALFDLNGVTHKPDSWPPYFTSVLAAWVDDRHSPQDYVSEDSAAWLINKISADGVVETETELKLLLNVLKTAKHVPDSLEKFALTQVQHAVVSGKGVIAGKMLTPGIIGEAEVALLRSVLYAGSSDGGIGITRTEAETLYALNDATSGRDNHSSWQTLFVQAIANHLMVISAPVTLSPDAALARQRWLSGETETKRNAFFRSFKALSDQRIEAKTTDGSSGYANLDTNNVNWAERIDLTEAQWVIDRILADGVQDENETALLAFIKAECPDIDAALQPYLNTA